MPLLHMAKAKPNLEDAVIAQYPSIMAKVW